MPTKYTYEQVTNLFAKNNCVLKTDNYVNQLQKLNYIASCGHESNVDLKAFLNGMGVKCRNCALDKLTYDVAKSHFESKQCILSYTKEEFDDFYKNCNQQLSYIASCGHPNTVCWKNYKYLNQGLQCPKCVNKNTGIKLANFRTGDNKNACLQEANCIQYFAGLIASQYEVKKLFDGCKADMVIKLNNEPNDIWLGIQVKSTNKPTERGQYYFRMNGNQYPNCLLLCMCDEDKKMWLMPYEDVSGLKTIGIAKQSKYNKYEVTTENLFQQLQLYYDSMNKFEYAVLNTPTNKSQQQELEYKQLREKMVDFIAFTNNHVEGLVYDFKIGEKKVQEKVGSITHNNPNSFMFNLTKYECRVNGKCKHQCYNEGDNDLYWLHCKNKKFYVIPENELISHGHIGKNAKEKLYVSPTNKNTEWCNPYLFTYDNVDKERLLQIINIK